MTDYQPIPVLEARVLAERYEKSIVIIVAHDPVHGLMHTTTYGTDPQNKAWAAQGGEIATKALGGVVDNSVQFEDYRLMLANRLLVTLKAAALLCEMCETSPAQIAEIRATVKEAEEYLRPPSANRRRFYPCSTAPEERQQKRNGG
jgi:hypothetical protein